MHYLEFLAELHQRLRPPTYLEVGVRHGDSLALAEQRAIGIDPRPRLRVELDRERTRIYRQTSDAFFERRAPLWHFEGRAPALSFIDGLHHAEFALRDFINVEAVSRWTGVIVFDDIFPQKAEWASRERETRAWTGDVFKLPALLREHRPDLAQLRVDVEPTGLLLVLGPNRHSTVLSDRYAALEAEVAVPDPQDVPAGVLERQGAIDPDAVLASRAWGFLRRQRGASVEPGWGVRRLQKLLREEFGDRSGLPLKVRAGLSTYRKT